jgi:hypothetical protein
MAEMNKTYDDCNPQLGAVSALSKVIPIML